VNGIACALIGRLPRDADPLKYTAQGAALVSFSVAVQAAKRGEDDPTEWARVTCWGELAEALDGAVGKGVEVDVEGRLLVGEASEVTVAAAARELAVDKATALRRARVAIDRGYLKNPEDRKRRPVRPVLGKPLPDDVAILPSVEALAGRVRGCTVAGETEGIDVPPSPRRDDLAYDDAEAEEGLPW